MDVLLLTLSHILLSLYSNCMSNSNKTPHTALQLCNSALQRQSHLYSHNDPYNK